MNVRGSQGLLWKGLWPCFYVRCSWIAPREHVIKRVLQVMCFIGYIWRINTTLLTMLFYPIALNMSVYFKNARSATRLPASPQEAATSKGGNLPRRFTRWSRVCNTWATMRVIVCIHMPRDLVWRYKRVIGCVELAGSRTVYKATGPGVGSLCTECDMCWTVFVPHVNRDMYIYWMCRMVIKLLYHWSCVCHCSHYNWCSYQDLN